MARRQQILKPGSTNFRRLRIVPETPGIHSGSPDTTDAAYNTLVAGGGFTGPSAANTASALGTVNVYDCKLLGAVYVPASNSAPTVGIGAFANVDFDGGTVAQFPLRPGDIVLIGQTMNWSPKSGSGEAVVYADLLAAAGFVCVAVNVVGNSTTTACRVQATVLNLSGASATVPAAWLPNFNIVRIEA